MYSHEKLQMAGMVNICSIFLLNISKPERVLMSDMSSSVCTVNGNHKNHPLKSILHVPPVSTNEVFSIFVCSDQF